MVQVLQWQVDCIRKRFKIYGCWNCMSILGGIVLVLAGSRWALLQLPNRQFFNLMFSVSLYLLFSEKVLTDNTKAYRQAAFYFQKLDLAALRHYYALRYFVVYEAVLLWVLFPFNIREYSEFCLLFCVSNLFLCLKILENCCLTK